MKKIKVEDAIGQELCHDITAMFDGFKGPLFKRGHVITEEDVNKLLDIGKKTVYVWDPAAGEVHEEDCALRLSQMTPVIGAHYEGPSEGKMVLVADERGMFYVNTDLLHRINSINDITITTLPNHSRVEKGDRLASMRIIPLVTQEENIKSAEAIAKEETKAGRSLMTLYPYENRKVGAVITGSEVYNGRIKDKFEPVIREKISYFGSEVMGPIFCDDNLDMIVEAAQTHLAHGADLLIFTGGMSVDPDDLTPTAIKRLGADIVSYGVPSQPGNMTLLAYLTYEGRKVTILGVPGAAISLKTTVFDVLLPQIYTTLPITTEDLLRLAEGGLCRLCKDCHFPNCTFGRY